jgi:hypothetical protein
MPAACRAVQFRPDEKLGSVVEVLGEARKKVSRGPELFFEQLGLGDVTGAHGAGDAVENGTLEHRVGKRISLPEAAQHRPRA